VAGMDSSNTGTKNRLECMRALTRAAMVDSRTFWLAKCLFSKMDCHLMYI
jgi:pullulanase/glycogen debranching enzyme